MIDQPDDDAHIARESVAQELAAQEFAAKDLKLVKHSLAIAGHSTSVSLENIFWAELRSLAAARGLSIAALVGEIDAKRGDANLSSALRVFILREKMARNET